MTTQWVREFIYRLFSDAGVFGAFLETPERVLADETITLEERRAALRLHARLATIGPEQARQGSAMSWP